MKGNLLQTLEETFLLLSRMCCYFYVKYQQLSSILHLGVCYGQSKQSKHDNGIEIPLCLWARLHANVCRWKHDLFMGQHIHGFCSILLYTEISWQQTSMQYKQ